MRRYICCRASTHCGGRAAAAVLVRKRTGGSAARSVPADAGDATMCDRCLGHLPAFDMAGVTQQRCAHRVPGKRGLKNCSSQTRLRYCPTCKVAYCSEHYVEAHRCHLEDDDSEEEEDMNRS